jgi:peptide/nickel transport system substrate-binding protein
VTIKERSRPALVLLLAAVAVLAASLVWGLGSALASPAASASASASPAAAPSPAAGTVVYRVGWLAEPDNLNPFIGWLWSSFEVWDLAYEPLVGYDYGTLTPTKGAQATGLATDWSVTPDNKTWTFTIRQDSTWSDGLPVTARDVAFTYNYIIKNQLSNFTSYVQYITKAVAVNDTTVRFDCSQPKANMLSHWVPILPEHIWSKISGKDASAAYANKPPFVGSGPFKCVAWKNNSYVEMVARKDYWRGAPKIDEILFEYYTNADSMVQDLKSGAIDGCSGLLSAQFRQLQNQPGIEARTVRVNGFDELGFNCYEGTSRGNPVLRDWKFRQALNYAVDKATICSIVYGGHAEAATSVLTAGYYQDPDWHWEPPADQKYVFDLEKAKQALDAAGYPLKNGVRVDKQGKPIELRLAARSESMNSQSAAKLLAGWFEQVGLKITLQTMDDGALSDAMYAKVNGKLSPDYDMFLWGWYSDLDPDAILSDFTTAQIGGWSDCAWSNAEYDKLYNEQARTLDPAARKQLIDRMQQIIYEQSPYIVLAYSNDLEAFDTTRWQGYTQSPAKIGNTLFPPYGNAGSENFLLIEPKTGATKESGGSSLGLWVAIGVAAVAVALIVLVVVRRRRPRATEE